MPANYNHPNSWGRTRSPKNITGTVGAKVQVAENTNNMLSGAAIYKTFGYATENQRYLHVLVEDLTTSDDPAAVTIFGYCHAFENWFEIPETETGGEGQNTANAAASIDIDNKSSLPAAQVPSDREYRVYEILGIDRVAFVCANQDQLSVWAACSTF